MTRRLLTSFLAAVTAWSLLGPGLPRAEGQEGRHPRLAARAPIRAPAVLIDSLGLEIGPVVGAFSGLLVVRLRAAGTDVGLFALADQLLGLFAVAEYESTDCTGAPLLREVLGPLQARPLVDLGAVGRLNELLVADGDLVTRTLRSRWTLAPPQTCEVIGPPGEDALVRPTRVLLDLGAFAPPFRLR